MPRGDFCPYGFLPGDECLQTVEPVSKSSCLLAQREVVKAHSGLNEGFEYGFAGVFKVGSELHQAFGGFAIFEHLPYLSSRPLLMGFP